MRRALQVNPSVRRTRRCVNRTAGANDQAGGPACLEHEVGSGPLGGIRGSVGGALRWYMSHDRQTRSLGCAGVVHPVPYGALGDIGIPESTSFLDHRTSLRVFTSARLRALDFNRFWAGTRLVPCGVPFYRSLLCPPCSPPVGARWSICAGRARARVSLASRRIARAQSLHPCVDEPSVALAEGAVEQRVAPDRARRCGLRVSSEASR